MRPETYQKVSENGSNGRWNGSNNVDQVKIIRRIKQ
jgi:hypothetical protein